MNSQSILLLSKEAEDRKLYRQYLMQMPHCWIFQEGTSATEGLERVLERGEQQLPSLILLNYRRSEAKGLDDLHLLSHQAMMLAIPLLLLLEPEDEAEVVSILKGSGQDYLIKGQFTSVRFRYRVGHLLEQSHVLQQLRQQQEQQAALSQNLYLLQQQLLNQKQAEEALLQSETTNRAILEAIPDLLLKISQAGNYRAILNPDRIPLLKPLEDLLLGSVYDVLPAHLAKQRMHYVQQVLETRRVQSYEYEIEIEGELRYEEARLVACSEDDVLVIIRDITDRKRAKAILQQLNQDLEIRVQQRTADLEAAQRLLQQKEEQLRVIFEAAPIGISLLDIQTYKIIRSNTSYRFMLGYSQAELEKLSLADITHPDDREQDWSTIQQMRLGRIPQGQIEKRYVCKDGSILWGNITIKLIWLGQENQCYCLGMLEDIGERKQAQALLLKSNEQLTKINTELERATRLKDEFLASMSHELRTPLNAILGISEGLLDQVYGNLTDRQNKAILTIENSGKHLLELINDILDLSKIESGKLELQITPVSVQQLCQDSLALVQQMAVHKQIELRLEIPNYAITAQVDHCRLRQVLLNLLSNAIKFTPQGGQVHLRVTIEPCHFSQAATPADPDAIEALPSWDGGCSCPDTTYCLCIAVIDTGIGIAPEDHSKLFQPFMQIDSRLNRQYPGTGLGLALVRRIVERHGGCITLQSKVGQGSCFTVRLPGGDQIPTSMSRVVSEVHLPLAEVHANLKPTAITEPSAVDRPLILLAEDNQANMDTLVDYLNLRGYRLTLARTGQDALVLAQLHQPDLIMVGLQTSDLEDLEIIHQIRQLPSMQTVPMIAVTSAVGTEERERYLAGGATECLTKPIRLKQLTETIHYYLSQP